MDEISYAPVTSVNPALLHSAIGAALTAARQTPFGAAPEYPSADALAEGPYGCITSDLLAHLAAAIETSSAVHGGAKALEMKGLVWRGIFAFNDVVCDGRFAQFGTNSEQRFYIGKALIEALAKTPMTFGGDVPVAAIYKNAADAVSRDGHLNEMTMLYPVQAAKA
jgi:hypothetical protein